MKHINYAIFQLKENANNNQSNTGDTSTSREKV